MRVLAFARGLNSPQRLVEWVRQRIRLVRGLAVRASFNLPGQLWNGSNFNTVRCMHQSFGCGRNFISGLINFKMVEILMQLHESLGFVFFAWQCVCFCYFILMYARNEPAQDNGSEGKCSSLLFTLLSVYEASSTLVQILIQLHAWEFRLRKKFYFRPDQL
jgi:hypothetical protein